MRNVHLHTSKTKRRSILFFEIGLICALSFALWAFNYSSETSDLVVINNEDPTFTIDNERMGEIEIVPDIEEVVVPTDAPQPTDQFKIVDNSTPIPEPAEPTEPKPILIPSNSNIVVDPNPIVTPDPGEDNKFILVASKMPSFPGGEEAMMKYIQKEINYPPLARENGIQGRAVVMFIVEKDGSISNIEVVKPLGWGIDEEAIRMVKSMPNWIPGENNFRPARVKIALPIKFLLH